MNDQGEMKMSRAELKEIIEETVDETLIKLGIEPEDHKSMQQDMLFLRSLRLTHEQVKSKGIIALVVTVVGGFCTLVVFGIKSWMQGSP